MFLAKFDVRKKATQPCPCGDYNPLEKECVCGIGIVQKYLNKISGPLLDRVDIHIEVTPVAFSELSSERPAESNDNTCNRVINARQIQSKKI